MIIKSIYLDGFRNYADTLAEFTPGVNIISGRNAQGKTNLIEAVYYIATGRTFRTGSDRDIISFGADTAVIKAEIISAGREQKLEARLSRIKRREFYANGVKLKKAAELAGRLAAVLFNPDDLDMIKDGAAVRRRLMDNCLSQLRPRYFAALTEFNRLHEHKTRILRKYREKPALLDLLEDYNHRMAEFSAQLIYYRSAFTALLAKKAADIHNEFSGGAETLDIRYKTVGGLEPSGKKPLELLPLLLEHQSSHRQAELSSGLCLSGAHKDDLEIMINGLPARKFASQGQARTAAVSIKLAERGLHFDDRGEYPVLLLDDVLSELDETRQRFLLEHIPDGQVFITACDDSQLRKTTGATVFHVEQGLLLLK